MRKSANQFRNRHARSPRTRTRAGRRPSLVSGSECGRPQRAGAAVGDPRRESAVARCRARPSFRFRPVAPRRRLTRGRASPRNRVPAGVEINSAESVAPAHPISARIFVKLAKTGPGSKFSIGKFRVKFADGDRSSRRVIPAKRVRRTGLLCRRKRYSSGMFLYRCERDGRALCTVVNARRIPTGP